MGYVSEDFVEEVIGAVLGTGAVLATGYHVTKAIKERKHKKEQKEMLRLMKDKIEKDKK